MKEKNYSSVGCLPTRPGLWWKLIQITKQMKKIKLLLAQINFPSEEDIPVWSIVIPQEGAVSPSHNPIWSDVMQNIAQWMKNRSMQIMQYKISCTIILNRYLSASALKVFWKLFRLRMQSTEGWQEHKCQWSFHIVRQDLSKIWPGWLKSSPFFLVTFPKYDWKLCKVQIVNSNKTRLHQSRLTKMIRSPTLATFSTTLSASLVTMSTSMYVVHHQRGIIQDGCCSEVVVKHEKLSSFHEWASDNN